MAESISESLGRIRSYLAHAEWKQAGELVDNLNASDDVSEETQIQLRIFQAQLNINENEFDKATGLITGLVNDVANWPKFIQIQILHTASQLTSSTHDFRMAEIYVNKFIEIYNQMSRALQDKSLTYLADITNIQGLIQNSMNNYTKALSLFEQASSLQRRLGRPFQQAISLYNAGRTANLLELPSRAEIFLEDSYKIFKELNDSKSNLAVSKELVKTYDLLEDKESKLSMIQISSDLEHQVEIDEINASTQNQIHHLKLENSKLQDECISLRTELHDLKEEKVYLQGEVDHLSNKVDEHQETKPVYRSLKSSIQKLEEQVSDQIKIINEQQKLIETQEGIIRNLREEIKVSPQVNTIPTETTIGGEDLSLDELLGSSKLLDAVYFHLKDIKSTKLRLLAMQLRISDDRCVEAIQQLEEAGAVKVNSWDSLSPEIRITDL